MSYGKVLRWDIDTGGRVAEVWWQDGALLCDADLEAAVDTLIKSETMVVVRCPDPQLQASIDDELSAFLTITNAAWELYGRDKVTFLSELPPELTVPTDPTPEGVVY